MEINLEEPTRTFNPREYYTVQEATALLGERSVSATKKLRGKKSVREGKKRPDLQRDFATKQGKIYGAEILRRLWEKGRYKRLEALGYDSSSETRKFIFERVKTYAPIDEAYDQLASDLARPSLVNRVNAVFDSHKQSREQALVAVLALSKANEFRPQRDIYSTAEAITKKHKLPELSNIQFYRLLEDLALKGVIERISKGKTRETKLYALEGIPP